MVRADVCLKSSVMGNSARVKRPAFAVWKNKKKEKSCYLMLFSLHCWWIATSYLWVHDSGGEWTNPAGEGGGGEGRGDALFFFMSFSGKLISFRFSFWAKKSATGPFVEMPHGHEISFRDMGSMEGEGWGEGGKDVLCIAQYKITILLCRWCLTFFEPIILSDD